MKHTVIDSSWRGHPITFINGQWIYQDTKQPTIGNERPCGFCEKENDSSGHDTCLGELPGIMNACCGHGTDGEAYVQFLNGDIVSGHKAKIIQSKIKGK